MQLICDIHSWYFIYNLYLICFYSGKMFLLVHKFGKKTDQNWGGYCKPSFRKSEWGLREAAKCVLTTEWYNCRDRYDHTILFVPSCNQVRGGDGSLSHSNYHFDPLEWLRSPKWDRNHDRNHCLIVLEAWAFDHHLLLGTFRGAKHPSHTTEQCGPSAANQVSGVTNSAMGPNVPASRSKRSLCRLEGLGFFGVPCSYPN